VPQISRGVSQQSNADNQSTQRLESLCQILKQKRTNAESNQNCLKLLGELFTEIINNQRNRQDA